MKQQLSVSIYGQTRVFNPDHALSFGRSPGSSVVIDGPLIAGSHLLVEAENGTWLAHDRSGGATFLNGRSVRTIALDRPVTVRLGSPQGLPVTMAPVAPQPTAPPIAPHKDATATATVQTAVSSATGQLSALWKSAPSLSVLLPLRSWWEGQEWRKGYPLFFLVFALAPYVIFASVSNNQGVETVAWAYVGVFSVLWALLFFTLARTVWRRSAWSPAATAADAVAAILLQVGGRANLAPGDRQTWLNWAPWSFAANAVAVQAIGVNALPVSLAGAAAIAAVAPASLTFAEGVATEGGMAAFFVGARLFARQIRGGASRLEEAKTEAVQAGIVLAAERERIAQLRVLHDGALQTLEAVGSGRYGDVAAIRAHAQTEAERLQRDIEGESLQSWKSFVEGIDAVIQDHTHRGLHVRLHAESSPTPSPAVARALREACHEALANVHKHAGTDHATVEIRTAGTEVEVVVSDQGRGFDPGSVPAGFGRRESIAGRLRAVGGRADIRSAPGQGTTVVLRGPA